MLFHFIKLYWRAILAIVGFALAVWVWLPAALKAKLSAGWKKFGHAIGNFNARVLLTLLYSVVILPFGLFVRLFADSMHMKKRPLTWFGHPPPPHTLAEPLRQ